MPFAPTDLSGLIAWHDATQIAGHVDGDRITPWPDLSGNAYDLADGGISTRAATYKTGIQNGHPMARYNRTEQDRLFVTGASFTFPTDWTVFCVIIPRTLSTTVTGFYSHYFWNGTTSGSGGWTLISSGASGGPYWWRVGLTGTMSSSQPTVYLDAGSGSAVVGTCNVLAWDYESTGHQNRLWVDGGLKDTQTVTANWNAHQPNYYTGIEFNSGNYGEADLGELIYYNRQLTDAERVQVLTYLGTKWNVAVGNENATAAGRATVTAQPHILRTTRANGTSTASATPSHISARTVHPAGQATTSAAIHHRVAITASAAGRGRATASPSPFSLLPTSAAGLAPTGNVIAIGLTYWDTGTSSERTVYFTDTVGFVTKPNDIPASAEFQPHIRTLPTIRRSAFAPGATRGRAQRAIGELELIAVEGDLDWLLNVPIDGRTYTQWQGPAGGYIATDFVKTFEGTMEQIEVSGNVFRVKLRDAFALLDLPFQTNVYAGDNVLPNGLEGTADDLKGKPKPKIYGTVWHVSFPCVNTTRRIFQVNDGTVFNVPYVWDAGIALTQEADYASQSDMESNAPSASCYRLWSDSSGSYIRLGTEPVGPVTGVVDEVDGATGESTAGRLLARILADQAGITAAAAVSAADIAAIDAAQVARTGIHWTIGILIDSAETTIGQALDMVVSSVWASYFPDRSGVWRIKEWSAPSGSPVLSLDENQIRDLEILPTTDTDRGLPAWKVNYHHLRNWTMQTSGLASGTDATYRTFAAEEYRTVSDEDASVQTAYLLSPEIHVYSHLVDHDEAQAECTRETSVRTTKRYRYRFRALGLDPSDIAGVDLCDVIQITYPRFGLDSGVLVRVLAIETTDQVDSLLFEVWR